MIAGLLLVVAAALIVLSGVYAAIDSGMQVTSRKDLDEYAAAGRNTNALERIASDFDAHAVSVAFARVSSATLGAVAATVACTLFFNRWWLAVIVAALALSAVTFVAVAASPREIGRRKARGTLVWFAGWTRAARIVFGPVALTLAWLARKVRPGRTRGAFDSEEQLLSLLDTAASEHVIEVDDRDLIHSVFDFTDRIVRSIMVPRTRIIAVGADATPDEALELFLDHGTSRMPLIDGAVDDVVGVLYLKDLVQHLRRSGVNGALSSVRSLARAAVFVPEQLRAETLLQQMKATAVHICLVIDEYGGIAGLVTLEDLIEELVGEIADEYDDPAPEVTELGNGAYRVPSETALGEVSTLLDLDLEDDEVDSIGGLLAKVIGRVPRAGDTARADGVLFTGATPLARGCGVASVIVQRDEAETIESRQDGKASAQRAPSDD